VLLLPETSGDEAATLMEGVRHGVAGAAADLLPQGGITASFGIAVMEGPSGTLRETMKRADKALYCSKMEGRDRVTLSSAADMFATEADKESWAIEARRRAVG